VSYFFRALALASLTTLSACVSRPVPPVVQPPAPVTPVPPVVPPKPTPPPTPEFANALAAGLRLGTPQVVPADQAERALAAFRISCPSVTRRPDTSGLTTPADWVAVCNEARVLAPGMAAGFFYHRFDWVQVYDGKAFATGYYEPEIGGSPVPLAGHVPVYRTPPDLTRCTKADGTTGRGRVDASGQCVYYFTRAEIEDGALANRGLEIAWAADPIELFFLQIQGSGRLRYPDGSIVRIGYDNQNGREYVAIGRLLRERGILPPGGASMKAIVEWMRANPEQGRALMRENLSYIFFKVLTGPGPLGALGVPVTTRTTVATDPKFVPLGAPAFLFNVDRREANGLWVAQDTGGAIKGPNRFDTFWGAGDAAEQTAGGMSASGQALVLIPKGAAQRALAGR
jgi:membrane-bound lytic murein transglycosylase A